MPTEDKLLLRIERFCEAAEMSPTTFGTKSINDPNLINDLKFNRELRRQTRDRVEKFLAAGPKKHLKNAS